MTDNADGGGGPDRDPPEIPAYSPDVWRHTSTLPGTMPVGGSRAEMAANHIARLAAGVQAGERIGSKDDIRHACGVSVGTVNEAIKIAQERGIITSRPGPGGGIFASYPSPLSRMNGWFRAAASEYSALDEAIQIRDALAPLLVDEVLARITDADQRVLNGLVLEVRRTRDAHDLVGFVWAVWNVHELFRWYRAQPTAQQSLSEHHGRRDLASAGASGSRRRDRAKRAGCFFRGACRGRRGFRRCSRCTGCGCGCGSPATDRPRNDFASDTEQRQQGRFAASGLSALVLRGLGACLCWFSQGRDLQLCSSPPSLPKNNHD